VALVPRPGVRVASVTMVAFGTATIGFSRIYLGVHWFSDVLTGWLLGGAWLAVCVTALLAGRGRPSPVSARRPSTERDG
jgi:undecaprenyl-diphosphatase